MVVLTDGGTGFYASQHLEEIKDGQHLRYYPMCQEGIVTVTNIRLSHDVAWVACGCSDGLIRLIHLATDQVDKLDSPHQLGTPIEIVRINCSNSSVALVSADGMISVTKT